jgi:hypothetical protein
VHSLIFILISAFLFSDIAIGAEALDVCEDLKPLVCSNANRDDGTGISKRIENYEIKKLMDIDVLSKKNVEKFKAVLLDPKNSEFREITFAALPFDRKTCPTPDSLIKENCANTFSFEMADMIDSENVGTSLVGKDAKRVAANYQKNLRNVMRLMNTQDYQTISADAYTDLMNLNKRPDQEKKIKEDIFPKVKEIMLQKVQNLNIDIEIKERMIKQLQKVEFGGFECLKNPRTPMKYLNSQYLPHVSLNHMPNERYEIELCRGISSFNESEFSLSFLLAHEIAHAFDPCNLDSLKDSQNSDKEIKTVTDLDNQYPLSQMLSCLRNPKSVGALNKIDYCKNIAKKPEFQDNQCEFQKQKPVSHCNGSGFNKSDQIGEAVSDAFAAEVMAEFVKQRHPNLTPEQWRTGVSNLLPEAEECGKRATSLFDEHPATISRYNKIVLAHPKIRTQMGCPEKSPNKIHCDPGYLKNSDSQNSQKTKSEASGVQQ